MDNLALLDLLSLKTTIGWTVLHSLWQLSLLVSILYLLLRAVPRQKAELRYALLLTGLLTGLIWTGITFAREWQSQRKSQSSETLISLTSRPEVSPTAAFPQKRALPDNQESSLQDLDHYIPAVSVVWFAGALVFSLYLLFGLGYLKYLQFCRVTSPAPPWPDTLTELARRMGIKRSVRLYISEAVHEPITFQLFQPVIMVPVFFFTGLTPAQIEALLLHELAHIRRHDFTVNLLQSLVEILLFFHPAVWWLSGKIREEREYCCDQAVLAIQKSPVQYAEALTRIQSNYFSHKKRLAMSANGKSSMLSNRVFRLFGRYDREPARFKSVLIICLLLILSFSTQAFLLQEAPPVQLQSLPIQEMLLENEPVETQELAPTEVSERENTQSETPEPLIPAPATAEVTAPETPRDTLPLFVIDGVKKGTSYKWEKEISPSAIKSVSVYKGQQAIDKYGQEGEYGVIEIVTKPVPEGSQPSKEKIIIRETPSNNEAFEPLQQGKVVGTRVSGKVVDAEGQPLIGTSILVKGTTIGTVTNFTGDFQLQLPDDCATLVFAYVGMKNTELKDICNGRENIQVRLKPEENTSIERPERKASTPLQLEGPIVTGKVVDESANPLIGASVVVRGTQIGTITDLQGDFRLQLPEACGSLIIAYTGMKGKLVEDVCKEQNMDIMLQSKTSNAENSAVTPPTSATTLDPNLGKNRSFDLKVFPNPAKEKVNITFQLGQATQVKLSIYTVDGKLLRTLVNENLPAGPQQFSWNAGPDIKGTFPVLLETEEGIARQQVVIE